MIVTPDLDVHVEVGSEGAGGGIVKILDLRPSGRLPALDAPAYRFRAALSADELKGHIREGRRLALEECAASGLEPIDMEDVVLPSRGVVPLDTLFGGRFLPRRLPPRRGAAGPAPRLSELKHKG